MIEKLDNVADSCSVWCGVEWCSVVVRCGVLSVELCSVVRVLCGGEWRVLCGMWLPLPQRKEDTDLKDTKNFYTVYLELRSRRIQNPRLTLRILTKNSPI